MNAMTKTENRPVREERQPNKPFLIPPVNITETKEGYLLEAEMPGVNKNGLEVLLEANELTIVGKRHAEDLKADLIYRESALRDFRRVFVLDPTIDTSKIDAKIENGVLTLHLPKAERVKPKKITVS
jgi:HSP20 family protein